MKIFAFLEDSPGGELKASQLLLDALHKESVEIVVEFMPPLQETGLLKYLRWTLSSWLQSAKASWRNRHIPIIYSTTYLGILGAWTIRFFTHQKLIFHYHGSRIPPLAEPEWPFFRRCTQQLKHSWVWWLHKVCLQNIELLCVPSLNAAEKLLAEFPGVRPRVQVLANGVDTKQFVPASEEATIQLRKQYHIPKNSFVCLVIGRVNPEKRTLETARFMQALQRFSRRHVLMLLAFPKQGNDAVYLDDVQKTLLSSEIPHIIVKEAEAVPELYQISDCVISHSAREVFPLVLLEAAACGIPYFAQPNGITEKYLAQINDELIIAASDQQAARQVLAHTHRNKMFEQLRNFARVHSWQATAVTMKHSLEKLIQL